MKRPGRKLATAERWKWKEICEACPESVVCPRGNVNMPHKKIVMGWRQNTASETAKTSRFWSFFLFTDTYMIPVC
ncbi:MAG: hypothetical protein PUG70_07090, partial [Lachnospiraceae bacterium]|nr:hypothetical protein [Lachnospiraceae bacterium]